MGDAIIGMGGRDANLERGFPVISREEWDVHEHVVLVDGQGVPTGYMPTEADYVAVFPDAIDARTVDELREFTERESAWDEIIGHNEIVFPRLKPESPIAFALPKVLGIGILQKQIRRFKNAGDPNKVSAYIEEAMK